MKIIKKDGTTEQFNNDKIKSAISKSAERVMTTLSDEEKDNVCKIRYT